MRRESGAGAGNPRRALRASLAVVCALVLAAACVGPTRRPSGGAVDVSGLAPFWAVAETLQRDEEPPEAAWDALFRTPGYAVMAAHDRSDRFLRTVLPVALMPSRVEERARWEGEQPGLALAAAHLASAVERRAELEELQVGLAQRDLVGEVADRALAWLPPSAARLEPPSLSFVVLQPDARGYEWIVMDLALARDLGDDFAATLAHEAHHVYRNALAAARRPPGELAEADLLAALDNLQAEGVADQIDKGDFLERERWGTGPSQRFLEPVRARYVEAYRRADQTLAELDRLLAEYGRFPERAAAAGRELRGLLVLGGHPVGAYMARTILDAFGRERLVERVGDPLAFARDYGRAAAELADGRHVLSRAALDGLEALERALAR